MVVILPGATAIAIATLAGVAAPILLAGRRSQRASQSTKSLFAQGLATSGKRRRAAGRGTARVLRGTVPCSGRQP